MELRSLPLNLYRRDNNEGEQVLDLPSGQEHQGPTCGNNTEQCSQEFLGNTTTAIVEWNYAKRLPI